jgi:glycosyltransferase involved in cell wall biosynthesis
MKSIISIGLYLNTKPSKGGTYQYTLSIIKALNSFVGESFSVTVFYHNNAWEKILPGKFLKVYYHKSIIRKGLSKFYKSIDRSSKGYIRFAKFFNPIIKSIDKSDCGLVIFPNQDVQAYQTKKKSLVSIHDLMHRYEPHFEEYANSVFDLREMHYKNICKYSSGILVDSEVGKQHVLESYHKDARNIFVLKFVPPHILLESKLIDIRGKYNLPDEFIFYPAQFWQHKNHENLIKAIKILKDKGHPIHLVLVGSKKNYYSKIIQLIETLKLSDNISILGYVSNDELFSLYKEALALVFVSLIGPTNIPPLEAMLLNCPVIVSNKYAMPEQVGSAGLLVDPLNPSDIAEKIEKIYFDKLLRQSLINEGIKKNNTWTQENFNKTLYDIITFLLCK